MTISIRHNTPASSEHTAHILRKTIVFILFGVGSSVVLLLMVFLTHTTPKIETQGETILVSPQVFQSPSTTPQERLKDFQKTDFYRTIVDNNLFRPLGWRPSRPRETYRLLGTILPTDAALPKQAILQKIPVGSTYTISIGDTLEAETTVIDIQPKQITLENAGVQRTLRLNTILWIK